MNKSWKDLCLGPVRCFVTPVLCNNLLWFAVLKQIIIIIISLFVQQQNITNTVTNFDTNDVETGMTG